MDTLNSKLEKLGLVPMLPAPTYRQVEWLNREMSAFFHFGINTFTDMEWGDGTENPSIFNPTELDCRQWIKSIRDVGFTSAILTAKHHDGFCLWPSKYTEHSVKNSPYKNGNGDIVREFTDACAEFGIKAGIYLSPWDRHEECWGKPEYNDFYTNQLTELLTNYGKIWEVWWDGAGSTEANYDWERWATTVRKLQPDAVIFGSLGAEPFVETRWVGNEKGYAGKPCWSVINSSSLVEEITSELNSGDLNGNRFIPAEADVSIRPGWFYHSSQDNHVRTPQNLIDLWFHSCGSNANILLNLPPNKYGLIHQNDVQNLFEFKNALTDALSVNLADGATVTATSERSEICKAENILDGDYNSFYASAEDDTTPEIILCLDGKKTFNSFCIQEVFELSHRVTEFEISAFVDGEWKLLSKGNCIGYRCAEHFPRVTTDKVKISITKSLHSPVIRSFGLHLFNEYYLNEATDTEEAEDIKESKIERNGKSYDIHLGGIYPFKHITVDSEGYKEFAVILFNGFDFEEYPITLDRGNGLIDIEFKEVIDWCYRIRIEFTQIDDSDLDSVKFTIR